MLTSRRAALALAALPALPAAGGSTDVSTRMPLPRMSEELGEPVVAENRAGAGGTIGSDAAAKAAPDGGTFLMGTISTHVLAVGLCRERLPYDPVRDLAAVAPTVLVPICITVRPCLGATDLRGFIELLRANPGRHAYGTGGSGGSAHIAAVSFLNAVGAGGDARAPPRQWTAVTEPATVRRPKDPELPPVAEGSPGRIRGLPAAGARSPGAARARERGHGGLNSGAARRASTIVPPEASSKGKPNQCAHASAIRNSTSTSRAWGWCRMARACANAPWRSSCTAARAATTAASSPASRRSRSACSWSTSTIGGRAAPPRAIRNGTTSTRTSRTWKRCGVTSASAPSSSSAPATAAWSPWRTAARHPSAVSHLVCVVTAAHGGFIPRAREIVAERGTPEQQRVCRMLWDGALDTLEKVQHYYAVMGPLYSTTYDAARSVDVRARTLHEPEALNRAFRPGGFLRSYDLRPELANVTAKTLILAGAHDWICAPEFSEEIHRLIPGSDLRIFANSSHSIRADEPEAMMDAIKGFVVY